MATKLFVGNLPFSAVDADLQSLFSEAGEVKSASVVLDRMTGKSRGFGFVEMGSESEAVRAVEALNGRDLNGRKITVSEARPLESRPPRGDSPRRFGRGRE